MTLQICVLCALGALALIADGLSVRRDGTKGAHPGNSARPRSGLAPVSISRYLRWKFNNRDYAAHND